jgi:hypothetical protein
LPFNTAFVADVPPHNSALSCATSAGAGHDASFGAIFKIASCGRMVPGWTRNFLFFRHVIPQGLRYTLRYAA